MGSLIGQGIVGIVLPALLALILNGLVLKPPLLLRVGNGRSSGSSLLSVSLLVIASFLVGLLFLLEKQPTGCLLLPSER